MPNALIRRLVILGGLSIILIIFVQSYWLLKTWDIKDKEFDQSVNIVLRNVAERMSKFNKTILPKSEVVQRRSSNYYAVNINSGIDAGLLEQYLLQEMAKQSLIIDFEYAVFDCTTDELVYGNYCSVENTEDSKLKKNKNLPKFQNLTYYFVVRFPQRENFLLANKNMALTLTLLSVLAIAFFYIVCGSFLSKKDFLNCRRILSTI